MHFANPELLLLLILIIPMAWVLKKGSSQLEKIFKPEILAKIRVPGSGLGARVRNLFFIAAFALRFAILGQQAFVHKSDLGGQRQGRIRHQPLSRAIRCAAACRVSSFLG